MATNIINPADNPVYEAATKAENHRIRERLRQIAYGYQCANLSNEELIIRRAIEEIFDPVLQWEDPDAAAAKVQLKVRR